MPSGNLGPKHVRGFDKLGNAAGERRKILENRSRTRERESDRSRRHKFSAEITATNNCIICKGPFINDVRTGKGGGTPKEVEVGEVE